MESRNLMDFDFGNLFYIIAMIIAVVVGVLGKNKRPKRGFSPTGAPAGGRSNFFDLLGKEFREIVEPQQPEMDFVLEEQPEPVPVVYEKEPEPVFEDEEESIILRSFEESLVSPESTIYGDLIQKEGTSSTGELQVIELDQNEGTDYSEFIQNFDIETAVIYSAIINRIDY